MTIGLKEAYKFYVEECKRKNIEYYDYKIYSTIIKEGNQIIRDLLVNESESLEMNYRLGKLSIIKFENTYDPDKQYKWKVDYKRSKEEGRIIYFGDTYGYRWKWHKNSCRVVGKRYYMFRPCRKASRMIKVALENSKIDYYSN